MQITWTDALSVGVDEIDNDHKELVQFYNSLAEAVHRPAPAEDIVDRMGFVCYYCIAHFGREEDLMKQAGYPGLEDHVALHNALQQKFMMLFEIYSTSLRMADAESIVSFVGNWLAHHIMGEDAKIGEFLRSPACQPRRVYDLQPAL